MSVTFIMPFRNCVRYLPENVWRSCLESIIEQRYKDWECLLIDDCSKDHDRSLNIAASYHEKRFKITKNNKHIGLTKSLNKGIAITNTEFIARHDSDDFSSKDRLEKEVDFLNKNKHVAVVGSFAKVYNAGLAAYDKQDKPISHKNISKAIRKDNPMIHGSVLIRTADIKQIGGYNEKFFVCQDYELWSRMILGGKILQNIPEYLYNRVSHKRCASKMYSKFRKESLLKIRGMHK